MNIIVDKKLQPNNSLCIVQIKELAYFILVLVAVLSNEGSGEPVHMCR